MPPYTADTSCRINITSGTTYKLFAWQYVSNKTSAISLSCSGLSCTYTKTNLTAYNVDKV